MKQKKVLILLAGLAAAGTAIYFIFRKDQSRVGGFVRTVEQKIKGVDIPDINDDLGIKKPPSITTPTIGGRCIRYITESFPLKKCMEGGAVRGMQSSLNVLYNSKIGVDNKFGPATEAALYKNTGKKQLTLDQYNALAKAVVAKKSIDKTDHVSDFFKPGYS